MGLIGSPHIILALTAIWAALTPAVARADDAPASPGLFDSVLQALDLKAKPADPAPEFVTRTRPDTSRLDFLQRPLPHKVSPIPVKTPGEVEALKAKLDAAHARQLSPAQPPVDIVTPKPAAPAKPAASAKPRAPAKPVN